ncbi:MAG: YtxH domain-containing protein [Elusimicrobiota bacterium]
MSNEDRGNGLFYFLAGTAVGAALGVLFAPRAGSETREAVGDWLKERKEKGSELLHKVKDESLIKKEALVAAARAAKDAYRETNVKHHDGVGA